MTKSFNGKCPNCGANLKYELEDNIASCEYCNSLVNITINTNDELNEHQNEIGQHFEISGAKLFSFFLIIGIIMVGITLLTQEEPHEIKKNEVEEVNMNTLNCSLDIDNESISQNGLVKYTFENGKLTTQEGQLNIEAKEKTENNLHIIENSVKNTVNDYNNIIGVKASYEIKNQIVIRKVIVDYLKYDADQAEEIIGDAAKAFDFKTITINDLKTFNETEGYTCN